MPSLPVLIGGMILDVQAVPTAAYATQPGGTVPGQIKMTSGGVARNVAQCLASLLGPENAPMLISIIGQDSAGDLLLQHWQSLKLPCNGILRKGGVSTPMTSYIFNQGGDVAASVADVKTVEDHLKPADLQPFRFHLQQASIVMLDANLSPETLEAACHMAHAANVPIWFEPVSVPKSMAAGGAMSAAKQLHLLVPFLTSVLKAGVKHVMLTLGSQGAALCTLRSGTDVLAQHLPALPARIVNTNGAGDCLVAGSLACLVQGQTPISALAFGMAVAKEGLEGEGNVPAELSAQAHALSAASKALLERMVTTSRRKQLAQTLRRPSAHVAQMLIRAPGMQGTSQGAEAAIQHVLSACNRSHMLGPVLKCVGLE
ncbi:hypothetical protein WJX79_010274 [Trebouxia sp. C0005]